MKKLSNNLTASIIGLTFIVNNPELSFFLLSTFAIFAFMVIRIERSEK